MFDSFIDEAKAKKPMTREQFDICKIMEKCGIKPEAFARSCREPAAKMRNAWRAATYEMYLVGLDLTEEMMDQFLRGDGSGKVA